MYLQVQITTPTKETAQQILQQLLEDRLIACGQIVGPITSLYHWEGKIEQSEEYLCLLKTTQASYPILEQRIIALHPYEVPEIIATTLTNGHADYLKWIGVEVKE